MTCSHVVAPYRWTEHFQEPWLEFVKDAHIECRLQLWRVCMFMYVNVVWSCYLMTLLLAID